LRKNIDEHFREARELPIRVEVATDIAPQKYFLSRCSHAWKKCWQRFAFDISA
jgi:hypothetical protein